LNTRLSDQLNILKAFQPLYQAALYRIPALQSVVNLLPEQQFEFVTVNLRKADTVIEAPPPTPDGALTLLG
jgi:hypothetical protein